MLALVQRVKKAAVKIQNKTISRIESGICVFLGIRAGDDTRDNDFLVNRLISLKIFTEGEGKFTHNLKELAAAKKHLEIIVVSQFTLYADVKHGTRPSFTKAMAPAPALKLYEQFCAQLSALGYTVKTGKFGAYMDVELINDGPVTFIMSSDQLPHHDTDKV